MRLLPPAPPYRVVIYLPGLPSGLFIVNQEWLVSPKGWTGDSSLKGYSSRNWTVFMYGKNGRIPSESFHETKGPRGKLLRWVDLEEGLVFEWSPRRGGQATAVWKTVANPHL